MSASLSFRHKFMIVSTGVVAGALAGVFFMGPLAIYKAWFGIGAVMLLLSLASMIGRGYFSTAVIMAGIAVLADPKLVFTVEAEIAGPLILTASNIMAAVRTAAAAAALLLALAGIYHRFGRKPAAVLAGILLTGGMIAAAGWYVMNSVAAKNAKAYEAALIGCAAEMQPAAKAAHAGIYKYISTRREAWHGCAVEKACMDAMCRLSFTGSTRFLDILRRAGDRVIIDETAVKYDAQLHNCGQKLSQLSAAETVEQYINAHPDNPQYAERIDWDLLDCMASGVCGQYEEQTGVREQTCRDAYINMHKTGVLSPSLDVMRNFNGETKK